MQTEASGTHSPFLYILPVRGRASEEALPTDDHLPTCILRHAIAGGNKWTHLLEDLTGVFTTGEDTLRRVYENMNETEKIMTRLFFLWGVLGGDSMSSSLDTLEYMIMQRYKEENTAHTHPDPSGKMETWTPLRDPCPCHELCSKTSNERQMRNKRKTITLRREQTGGTWEALRRDKVGKAESDSGDKGWRKERKKERDECGVGLII